MRNHGQDLLCREEAGTSCSFPAALHVTGMKGIQPATNTELRRVSSKLQRSSHPMHTIVVSPHHPQAQDHRPSLSSNMMEVESHLDYGQPHVFVG